jgi:hypothetical protein
MLHFIKTDRAEGQLLIAAMVLLTGDKKRRSKTPEQVLESVIQLQKQIYPQNVMDLQNRESEYETMRVYSLERDISILNKTNENIRQEHERANKLNNQFRDEIERLKREQNIDEQDIANYIRTAENMEPGEKISISRTVSVIKKLKERLDNQAENMVKISERFDRFYNTWIPVHKVLATSKKLKANETPDSKALKIVTDWVKGRAAK